MPQAIVKHAFSVYGVGDKLGDVDTAWLAKMVELGVVVVEEEGLEPEPVAEPPPVIEEPLAVSEPPPVEVLSDEFQ